MYPAHLCFACLLWEHELYLACDAFSYSTETSLSFLKKFCIVEGQKRAGTEGSVCVCPVLLLLCSEAVLPASCSSTLVILHIPAQVNLEHRGNRKEVLC